MIRSDGKDLSDFSMIDLFRSEVETHVATLNDGLLALESNPTALDNIEALMRAAHSIKGGARIVELDPAVKLAHMMEDCFVAIQKREFPLMPEHIDTLLKGVDMLSRIAEAAGEGSQQWLAEHQEEINKLFSAISAITSGEKSDKPQGHQKPLENKESKPETKTTPKHTIQEKNKLPVKESKISQPEPEISEPEPKQKPEPKAKPIETKPSPVVLEPDEITDESSVISHVGDEKFSKRSAEKDRVVRVTAGKVERLMGLAGEVVLSARWLPPFSKSLVILKKSHAELNALIEKIERMIEDRGNIDLLRNVVNSAREKLKESNQYLLDRMNQLDVFTGSVEMLADRLYHEIIGVRMSPFADGIRGFPRMIRDIARKLGKQVRLNIVGESTEVDRDILEKLDAPLIHLIRNSIDHGIELPEERIAAGKPEIGTIRLEASHRSGILLITVADDGRGVNFETLKQKIIARGLSTPEMVEKMNEAELLEFLFLPGFSTVDHVTEVSGRGVGLDVVHNMVHSVGGVVRAVSKPGKGMAFHLELPLTLSVIRTFLVEIAKEPYAFPLARIERCLMLSRKDIQNVEDREYFIFDGRNIALVDIHDVLSLRNFPKEKDELPVVVVSDRMNSYGLVVDKFLGEYDLVVRPLDSRLGKVPGISAASIMLDGSPVLIFDIEDLVRSIDSILSGQKRFQKIGHVVQKEEKKPSKRILVVDDSITVREMERKLLENKGYSVEIAVDGMDGWNMVRTSNFDMVISDVDMPRMNGIELITQIKRHERLKSLPVMIVSYKNKEEDRLKGLEAGADYYLTKTSFHDDSFINAVVDLIGEA